MYINHKIRIKGTDEFLVSKEKQGREVMWITSLRSIKQSDLSELECMCVTCKEYFEVKLNHNLLHREKYECYSCQRTGDKNNFYGKSHCDEFKHQHSRFMKGRYTGVNNPFYGKNHSNKTKAILSEKCGKSGKENGFYGKTHTEKVRKILSEKTKKYAKENRELISQRAIKALKNKKYKKTIPEKLVEEQLIKMGIPHTYNKIIQKVGQFDFIISDKILLEVHGDYWHGNPDIYGEGKRPLNERQLYKQGRDSEKKYLATQKGYKIFYIWETDIKKQNWEVIYQIKRLLNENIRISGNR